MRADALRARLERDGLLVRWPSDAPPVVTAVSTDSRRVPAGALFAAYQGTTSDAHAYVAAAARAGARLALVEHEVADAPVPQVIVRDGRAAAAAAAALCFGDPGETLDLVAVTGTNGKTTTVHLLRHLFGDRAPAGSIGTLGAIDGEGRVLPDSGSLTTPGPVELQAVLAGLRDAGARTVAMEVSSHSLDQGRVSGLRFRAAVFTNLTRDHLDYHGDEAAYLAAKCRLDGYLAPGGYQVVNAEDPAWRALPPRAERVTFGIAAPADVRAADVEGDGGGMRFMLAAQGRSARSSVPLPGRFNVENALGAAAAAIALGRDVAEVAGRRATAPHVPGRMERLSATPGGVVRGGGPPPPPTAPQVPGRMERLSDTPCVVVRDFAHTPDALERVLAALRPLTRGRLLVLFGAGGDRDRGKRPLMGAIAARDADLSIVTSDNPRTEDPERILDDIEAGMGQTPHLRIADRRAAILRALSIARPDDVLLLAGKGHETYQVVGRDHLPFDEREIVAGATGTGKAGS